MNALLKRLLLRVPPVARRYAELTSLRQTLKECSTMNDFRYHIPKMFCHGAGMVTPELPPDADRSNPNLVQRIAKAYKRQCSSQEMMGDGYWNIINELKRDVHEALLDNDIPKLDRILQQPIQNNLFYGFEICTKNLLGRLNDEERNEYLLNDSNLFYANMIRLAEAWGCMRLFYPEGYPPPPMSYMILI